MRFRFHVAQQITANVVSNFRRYRRASQHSVASHRGRDFVSQSRSFVKGRRLLATSGFRIEGVAVQLTATDSNRLAGAISAEALKGTLRELSNTIRRNFQLLR
jgi:hypothetical protein